MQQGYHIDRCYEIRNHSLIVSSSRSSIMLMALPTLGPVLLALMCSFTYFTFPHALQNSVCHSQCCYATHVSMTPMTQTIHHCVCAGQHSLQERNLLSAVSSTVYQHAAPRSKAALPIHLSAAATPSSLSMYCSSDNCIRQPRLKAALTASLSH